MENNAQLQKLYLATRPETGFIFHLHRDILWISPADIENICFAPSRKKYRGPETGLMLDQRKITSYIMFRTIYLQFVFLIN